MTTGAVVALLFIGVLAAIVWASRRRGDDPETRRRTAEDRLQARELRNVRRRERDEDDPA